MKTAVEAVFVGKERLYNRRFLQMCSHYLVQPVACTPASGWEKGQLENQVGLVRERFFTPRLRVKSLEELNVWLLDKCVAYAKAINQLHASSRAMAAFFSRYDVMLTPAAAEPAPLLGKLAGRDKTLYEFYDLFWSHSPFTAVFNTSGCPAMSVPLGMSAKGLPVGSHFGAAFGKDALLLSLAAELERSSPWINRRPALFG